MSGSVRLVDLSEVKYLWHCEYWDGARSGVALFEGKRCWFLLEKETFTNEGCGLWHFLVVKLSEKELTYEEKKHDEFRKYVGHHTDYGEDGKILPYSKPKPREEQEKFYSKYLNKPKRDYSQNKPLCRCIW